MGNRGNKQKKVEAFGALFEMMTRQDMKPVVQEQLSECALSDILSIPALAAQLRTQIITNLTGFKRFLDIVILDLDDLSHQTSLSPSQSVLANNYLLVLDLVLQEESLMKKQEGDYSVEQVLFWNVKNRQQVMQTEDDQVIVVRQQTEWFAGKNAIMVLNAVQALFFLNGYGI